MVFEKEREQHMMKKKEEKNIIKMSRLFFSRGEKK